MVDQWDEALHDCLERIRAGESLDICLARYPDLARDLRPLLQVAQALGHGPHPTPSAAALARGEARLQSALAARRTPRLRMSWPTRRRGWALSSLRLAMAFTVLVLALAITTAAQASLPDSPLYPVKLASENARLLIASDPVARATLQLTYSERRLNELQALAARGEAINQSLLTALQTTNGETVETLKILPPALAAPLATRFVAVADAQAAVLATAQVSASPEMVTSTLTALNQARVTAASLAGPPDGRATPAPGVSPMATPSPLSSATPTSTPTLVRSPTYTPLAIPSPTAVIIQSPTATPLVRVRLEGLITSIVGTTWHVAGETVHVDGVTPATAATTGLWAEIEGVRLPTGVIIADSIRLRPLSEVGDFVEWRGIIQAMAGDAWIINGTTVNIMGTTEIVGGARIGLTARVRAIRIGTQTIALRIDIEPVLEDLVDLDGTVLSIQGDLWTIGLYVVRVDSSTQILGPVQVGSTVHATATRTSGGLLARRIALIGSTTIDGILTARLGNQWTIGSQTVTVDASTFLDESAGRAVIGARLQALVRLQNDGTLLALRIRVVSPAPRPTSTPTQTVSPPGAPPSPVSR